MSKQQYYEAATYRARDSVGYLAKRSHSLMHDFLEPVIAERGFTFVQYVIMAWLRDGLAVNPRDFCAQFRYDSGALTRVIDQLAERGLIERVRRDRDRRKLELRLTPAGEAAAAELIPPVVERMNAALSDFTHAEVRELERLLIKLNTRLQDEADPAAAVAVEQS